MHFTEIECYNVVMRQTVSHKAVLGPESGIKLTDYRELERQGDTEVYCVGKVHFFLFDADGYWN